MLGLLHSPRSHSAPSQHSRPQSPVRAPRAAWSAGGTHRRPRAPGRSRRRALRRGGPGRSARAPLAAASSAAAEGSERKHLGPTPRRTPPPGPRRVPQSQRRAGRPGSGRTGRRAPLLARPLGVPLGPATRDPRPVPGPSPARPQPAPGPRARRPSGPGESFPGRIRYEPLLEPRHPRPGGGRSEVGGRAEPPAALRGAGRPLGPPRRLHYLPPLSSRSGRRIPPPPRTDWPPCRGARARPAPAGHTSAPPAARPPARWRVPAALGAAGPASTPARDSVPRLGRAGRQESSRAGGERAHGPVREPRRGFPSELRAGTPRRCRKPTRPAPATSRPRLPIPRAGATRWPRSVRCGGAR